RHRDTEKRRCRRQNALHSSWPFLLRVSVPLWSYSACVEHLVKIMIRTAELDGSELLPFRSRAHAPLLRAVGSFAGRYVRRDAAVLLLPDAHLRQSARLWLRPGSVQQSTFHRPT